MTKKDLNDRILNPKTNRFVLKYGKIGTEIINNNKEEKKNRKTSIVSVGAPKKLVQSLYKPRTKKKSEFPTKLRRKSSQSLLIKKDEEVTTKSFPITSRKYKKIADDIMKQQKSHLERLQFFNAIYTPGQFNFPISFDSSYINTKYIQADHSYSGNMLWGLNVCLVNEKTSNHVNIISYKDREKFKKFITTEKTTMVITENGDLYSYNDSIEWKLVKACEKRFIVISFDAWKTMSNPNIPVVGHAGRVIIDKDYMTVSVLNPHGANGNWNILYNSFGKYVSARMNELYKKDLDYMITKFNEMSLYSKRLRTTPKKRYTFESVEDSCSKKGIQYIEWKFNNVTIDPLKSVSIHDPNTTFTNILLHYMDTRTDINSDNLRVGHCTMWTVLMTIARLYNPTMSVKETQVYLEEWINSVTMETLSKCFLGIMKGILK
jgi:hypothetical protein